MNTVNIYQQLVDRLMQATLPDVVQYENERVETEPDEPYWRVTFTPFEPQNISTGADLLTGAFQVSMFYPLDSDTTPLNDAETEIIELFPRGLRLSDEVTIEVVKSYRVPHYSLDKYYGGGVIVQWRSHQMRAIA